VVYDACWVRSTAVTLPGWVCPHIIVIRLGCRERVLFVARIRVLRNSELTGMRLHYMCLSVC
jgi:hypothetical protein